MEDNIYSSPKSDVEIHTAEVADLAGRWSRLGASIIDSLTVAPITVPLMYFTGAFEGVSEGGQSSLLYTYGISAIGIIAFIIVHGYFLVRDGQTLGKKILSIKIVTVDNRLPDISNLIRRYALFWLAPQIPVVGLFVNMINILFIFTKSKRCLHDYAGGTKVVQANR